MTEQWFVTTYAEAVAGLRDRAGEFADYPTELHTHEVSPFDLLGGPKLAPAFLRWLARSAHDTTITRQEKTCPFIHPPIAPGTDLSATLCAKCGGFGTYVQLAFVYTRPLARALWSSERDKSNLRPRPHVLVYALIAAGFDLERAARLVGIRITSRDQRRNEEARFLSAIRNIRDHYIVTAPGVLYTEKSESQRNAEEAGPPLDSAA